jgi:hypothetical protein
MSIATEDITMEGELAYPVWNKSYFLDNARPDINPKMKLREVKAVVPILADEFQCHRHALPEDDLARLELES